MARQVIGSPHDDSNLNKLNSNFAELYQLIGIATGTDKSLKDFLEGTGVISSRMLEYGAVHGNYIREGGVGTRHLLDGTVTESKIGDGAVTKEKIANGSVDGNKIGDATIFSNHLRLGAVGERELATGGVTSEKIRNEAVGENKVQDGAITRNKIGWLAVDTSKLDYGSVTLDRLAENSVSAPKILNGAVYRSKLSDNYMFNQRVTSDIDMSTLQKDGTYIIDADNKGSYPTPELRAFICSLQVERMEGWIHQTISRLQSPEVSYKRWVGVSSGTVSNWQKVHIGGVDGGSLLDGTVTRSKVEDGAISAVKLLDGAGFRRKLSDDFMYVGRLSRTEAMETTYKDGTYIVDADNTGIYPNESLRSVNCAFKIESYQSGWIHQTISPLTEPENKFVRWVGKSSGSVSEWKKIAIGELTGADIKDGSITPEKLSMDISEVQRKPLKIFMVGNSFALDICDALYHICAECNVDITIGVTYLPNANLETHYNNLSTQNAVYNYHEYKSLDGEASKSVDNGVTLQTMLNKHDDWDLITFQQQSSLSDDYSTYQPYLNDLINDLTGDVSNNPKIGMVQTWANSTSRRPDQLGMYNGLVNAYEEAIAEQGIGVLIPCGTAIQSARTNEKMNNDGDELTRDGYHLSPLGKYVAGLSMFESIISGYYKRDIFTDVEYIPEGISDYQAYKAKLSAKNSVLSPQKTIEL